MFSQYRKPIGSVKISNSIKIKYDNQKHTIIYTLKGTIFSEDFRKLIQLTLDYANYHQLSFILADVKHSGPIAAHDLKYAASAMPYLKKKGLRSILYIVPENIYTKFALARFVKSIHNNDMKFFFDSMEAYQWLDMISPNFSNYN